MGKVLVVEDDATIRKSLERVLTKLCPHCEIRVAEDGAEALSLLEQHPADLVISDHSMPGMSGLELLALVREQYPYTLRVLVTAYPISELNASEVEAADLSNFIAKPFQLVDIKNLIDSYFSES